MPVVTKDLRRQWEYAACLARFLTWVTEQGLVYTLADGNIDPERRIILKGTSIIAKGRDANHLVKGNHYRRLAQDINLFRKDGTWLKIGNEPEWAKLGAKWKSMHPEAAWGGDFGDPNHFSFKYGVYR